IGADSTSNDTVPSDRSYPAGIYFDTTYYTSLTVSNYCGVSVQNLDIISMPVPVSRFGPYSNVGGCASGTITLANNSYGLPDSFYWDFGDGSFGTNNDTLFDHYYTPGPSTLFYTITMAVTNECGTDTTVETVTILPSDLVAFFSVDTTVGCAPFTLDFEQFSVGGATSSWDFNDGNFSNAYSPTHTFTDSGTYEVSLAVSNVCNFDTAYKTIRVNTSPNVSFSVIDDTLCAGSTFQFNNSSDFAISNNWNFGDGATSFLTNPTHIYADSGSYRAILTGTSLTNNCPAFDSVDLVVLPYPEIIASSDTSNGCIPLPVNFSSTVNSVGYYLWDFGDGNSSNLANPYHTYSTEGYYSVNVRFEDLTGCVDSFDFNVNPYPIPQTNFVSQQLDTCVLPINYNFQNLTLGGSSYSWDFGDGNVSSLSSPAHSYTAEGNYDINLITSNTYGCEDSISKTIIVNPVPSSQFDAIQLDTCSIPANYNFANNSTGAIAYIWDFGDGVASNLPNLSHTYNSDGTYEISLISMNAVGCFDTSFVTINVIPVPDLSFSFTPLDTCTVPASFSFQNTSSGVTNYLWDFGDGLYSPLTSPFHTFNAAGDYNVNLTSTNIFGCSDTSTQLISVNPIPVAQFTPIQLDTCTIPASYSLVNTSSGSIVYSWSLGDGSNTNSASLNYAYTNSGTYDITLSAMNQYGCFDSSTVTVIVPPIPTADFSSNKLDLCVLPSNYSFTNNSVGASNYIWTFDTLANSIQTNPFFTFNNDGIYEVSLLATNSSGCSDSIIEFINVNPIPVADFNLDTTIGCEPFTAIFTNTSQNATFYNWDFNDGNYGAFFNGFHQFQNFGNYTVNLVVEDINGCRDSTFKNLNVYPSPVSSYTYVSTDPCYLPIAVDYTNTSTGANSFQWNFGGLQSTTVTNPSFIYDSIGIYNIQLISGNSYNCYDTLNNIFDVFFNQVPNAQFNFDNSICFRDTSFFNSASLYADSLVWDLG
ncbi:MAG: PKD domain-containing protein, partial [Flavobacteriales bacterium]|nr:PKD domain-containing protein [Flavobacteriales bacterium]